jgi:pyruvate kinase
MIEKKTKILCTLGPASNSPDVIRGMVKAGMNGARINTSHGDFEQYRTMIETVRSIAALPIVMDTQGSKIRLRMKQDIEVREGDRFEVGFNREDEVYLDADVFEQLEVGDRALVDDGVFEAFVECKKNQTICLHFSNGGTLTSGRAVNFPKKKLPLEALNAKDKQSLRFAKEMKVDFIALSFTRTKEDIDICRYYLQGGAVKIIAKIENQQGVDHFDEILEHADGIMIARGDMGVELEPEEIPIIQKRLIQKCNEAGKPVITATQMLQSMISHPRPTRAETSDVANAILDGSDVVMLSGETASGRYPVKAVQMMARIAMFAEQFVQKSISGREGIEGAICDSIKTLCEAANVDKIVTVTRRGYTAKLISRLRLQPEIFALTFNEDINRELHLYYGVQPVMCPFPEKYISPAEAGMFLYEKGLLREQELVLFASGEYHPKDQRTNTIQIIRMQELADYCREQKISCQAEL